MNFNAHHRYGASIKADGLSGIADILHRALSHIGSMNMDTTGPDSSCSVNGTIGFEQSAIVLTMSPKLPQLEAASCNDPGTTFQSGRV
jgi:hypothetical protein